MYFYSQPSIIQNGQILKIFQLTLEIRQEIIYHNYLTLASANTVGKWYK